MLHLISRTVLAGLLHRPNEVGTPLGLAPRSCLGRLRATTRCKFFSGSLRPAASEAELRYGPLENRSSLLQHTTVKATVRNRNIVIYGNNVCIYYGLILYLYYWYYATTTVQKPHPSICSNLKLKLISSDLHTVLDLLHLLFAHFNM